MNIKQITDNLLCSGCGTCNTICGHNAISMKRTHTMKLLYADNRYNKVYRLRIVPKNVPKRSST